jgi:uncharacterized protein
MPDLLKISAVFLLILLLLRKKFNIGLVMLAASVALFFLYRMALPSIIKTCEHAVLNGVTIKLVLALSFIRMLEQILREHDVLSRMMASVKALFKNRKAVTISMPLLIGLMPSIGGAYFSAPMVAETTRDVTMSPEEKGFINYWFRHPWEYILPLYPGILLAAALSKADLHALITANITYAFIMVVTGFLFAMRGLRGTIKKEATLSKKDLWSFAPIFAVLLLVSFLHIELHYALTAVVLFLYVFYRYSLKAVFASLKHGFSIEVIILIFGVMVFKEAMENSGAVENLSLFFMQEGIPVLPILFLLPFITGLLTGITVGFVGSTFPLIASIAGNTSVSAISFAFAAGFLGVLLSPVHICLILTREYFKADIWGIYKLMIPGCIVIFIAAIVQYLLLR